ncbi:hypothetical protein PSOL_02060 [Candidatus Phytoplasma solani]
MCLIILNFHNNSKKLEVIKKMKKTIQELKIVNCVPPPLD